MSTDGRRDRTGEPLALHHDDDVTQHPTATAEHDPRCRDGWLDRDADRPVPCPTCKPHTQTRRRWR